MLSGMAWHCVLYGMHGIVCCVCRDCMLYEMPRYCMLCGMMAMCAVWEGMTLYAVWDDMAMYAVNDGVAMCAIWDGMALCAVWAWIPYNFVLAVPYSQSHSCHLSLQKSMSVD